MLVHDVPKDPSAKAWRVEIADSTLHTIHNLQLVDMDGDGRDEIVVAAWEGVFMLDRSPEGRWTKLQLGTGNQQMMPFKGASEVKVGRLLRRFAIYRNDRAVAWFSGSRVYSARTASAPPAADSTPSLWGRHVIAEPVQWGHAVWCADLDADGDDELIVGQRDPNKPGTSGPKGPGVFVFDIKHAERLTHIRQAHD